jgi:hypothetical protein
MLHFLPKRLRWSHSQPNAASESTALAKKNTTTAERESALPISTEAIVETARDNGKLQKILSTIERCRKP